MKHVDFAAMVLAASTLIAFGCTDARVPTEPGPIVTPAPANGATLSGTVTDRSGAPQPGLVVRCQGKQVNTTTGGGPVGFHSFSGLVTGKSTLDVYPPGQKDPTTFELNLVPGANTRDVSIVVVRGEPASMSGKVVPQTSRPIAGVTIYCQLKSAPVAADGSYLLAGLESGYWEVFIGWDGYTGEYYKMVTLFPGANAQDFNIPY